MFPASPRLHARGMVPVLVGVLLAVTSSAQCKFRRPHSVTAGGSPAVGAPTAGEPPAVTEAAPPKQHQAQPAGLINDRLITIKSAEDIARKRRELIHFIWGPAG